MKTISRVLALLALWVVASIAVALANLSAPGPFSPIYWWVLSFTIVGGLILMGVVAWERLHGKE